MSCPYCMNNGGLCVEHEETMINEKKADPTAPREFWIYQNEEHEQMFVCYYNQRGFIPENCFSAVRVREVTDDKPVKSNVTCMREPEINVGGYLISHFEGGGYWITGPDGDGMQTTIKFEKLIADFFREEM